MEHLTLIQSERIDSLHEDIREIKQMLREGIRQSELNKWITKKEARERLHVSLKTLDSYLNRGILPHSRFAGKIYIKAGDIEAHLSKHYIKS